MRAPGDDGKHESRITMIVQGLAGSPKVLARSTEALHRSGLLPSDLEITSAIVYPDEATLALRSRRLSYQEEPIPNSHVYSLPAEKDRLLADFARFEWENTTAYRYQKFRAKGLSAPQAYRAARALALRNYKPVRYRLRYPL